MSNSATVLWSIPMLSLPAARHSVPECKVFPFASIGQAPQDVKFHGEPSTLMIGAKTTIREHATINPGTESGHMATKVGSNCLLMIGAHVAHDCEVAIM
jgi:UDP-N-acetylglucosamine acyltransferase